jgi:predicted ATPase
VSQHFGDWKAIAVLTRIEALRFRCLRHISQPIADFHVLVGPNASGKTTFLDIPALLGRLVTNGLDAAVEAWTQNFQDLIWNRNGESFEIAVEAAVPTEKRVLLSDDQLDTVRYEVALGLKPDTGETAILGEKLILKRSDTAPAQQRLEFPNTSDAPATILTTESVKFSRTVINKRPGGSDNFYDETGKVWDHAFKLGPRKSALANLPEDETRFPVSSWFKGFLATGVQQIVLNSLLIRKASPPGQVRGFKPDGSNLPWVVADLERNNPKRLQDWVSHLRTALPDLVGIRTVEREDDKHRYLLLKYSGGLEVPSWMASDGTLRLLALTLPAYMTGFNGVYLIEEPENGIHPRAVDTMYQSLSSVYDAQILMATHSPVILSIVDVSRVLCFAKTTDGVTDIVSGDRHPALKEWRGETDLATLFGAGVLG